MVSDLYVCMHKHAKLGGSGACSLRKSLESRCSEIASEAILGQKQSRSSYMARGELHPMSMYAFAKPADFGFPLEKVLSLRLAEQQVA